MTKPPELHDKIEPPNEVIEAAMCGELVIFVGSGISMLCKLPSWRDLAKLVLNDLRQINLLNYSEIEQLETLDPRKQLSIALQIAKDKEQPLDLAKHFKNPEDSEGVYKALNDIGCVCITTNYDELLMPKYKEVGGGSSMPLAGTRVYEPSKFSSYLLDNPGTIIHLHGAISKPETMIVTTRRYLEHYDNKYVQEILHELFAKKTVVFMGYGLDEVEILEHILRRGSAKKTPDRKRFVLQGFFQNQTPLFVNLHRYYEESFGVKLLGFLRDRKNYECQVEIIENWARKLQVKQPSLVTTADLIDEIFHDE